MNIGLGKVTFDSIGNRYFQVEYRSYLNGERGNSPSAATPCTWVR